MSKQKVKVLKDGDNTFYHFDKDTGFWGIPSIQHSITYPVAPNKIFKIKPLFFILNILYEIAAYFLFIKNKHLLK